MAAHDLSLWEVLTIWTLRCMLVEQTGNRKWPCYLAKRWISLSRAGKDNNLELKTGQKSIIEAVVCQKRMCSGFYQQASASHLFFIFSVSLFVVDGGRRKERLANFSFSREIA